MMCLFPIPACSLPTAPPVVELSPYVRRGDAYPPRPLETQASMSVEEGKTSGF